MYADGLATSGIQDVGAGTVILLPSIGMYINTAVVGIPGVYVSKGCTYLNSKGLQCIFCEILLKLVLSLCVILSNEFSFKYVY